MTWSTIPACGPRNCVVAEDFVKDGAGRGGGGSKMARIVQGKAARSLPIYNGGIMKPIIYTRGQALPGCSSSAS